MRYIKNKNIIILLVILLILILLKLVISPLNKGIQKIEVKKLETTIDSKEWMTNMEVKINNVKETCENNNISCEYKQTEIQSWLESTKASLTVNDFTFKFFLDTIDDSTCGEFCRINFEEQENRQVSIYSYEFLKNLINSVTEQNNYDYNNINKKIQDAVDKVKKDSRIEIIEEKIEDYNVKIEVSMYQKGKINYKFEIKKDYKVSKS